MYNCKYTFTYTHICIRIYIHICTCIHIYVHTCMGIWYIYIYTVLNIHKYALWHSCWLCSESKPGMRKNISLSSVNRESMLFGYFKWSLKQISDSGNGNLPAVGSIHLSWHVPHWASKWRNRAAPRRSVFLGFISHIYIYICNSFG